MLTNGIEHVTLPARAEVSTRKVKKIKCGSTDYSKTIENKKKPLIIFSTHEFHSGYHPAEVYTKMSVMLMNFKSMRSLVPTLTVRLLSVALKL